MANLRSILSALMTNSLILGTFVASNIGRQVVVCVKVSLTEIETSSWESKVVEV